MADSQRYAHQAIMKSTEHQKIDINNVVTLLQKAECEKIDAQLDDCVKFCHSHADLLLSQHGPAVAALSDAVINKMAVLFNHNEVDELSDKKDRIKSKLFRHLTERLLGRPDSTGSGQSSIFRCRICQQLLTTENSVKVKCRPNRVALDRRGNTLPRHERDEQWDVTSYVRDVYFRHRSWRRVYWSLWAQLTCLTCDKCGLTFPGHRLGQCVFHPDAALYTVDHDRGVTAPLGTFPCCQQVACKFDPWDNLSKGCTMRDHLVQPKDPTNQAKLQDLLQHRENILATLNANEETDGIAKPITIEIPQTGGATTSATASGATKTAARQAFNASVIEAARRCAAAAKTTSGPHLPPSTPARNRNHRRRADSDNGSGSDEEEEEDEEESDSGASDSCDTGRSESAAETEEEGEASVPFELPLTAMAAVATQPMRLIQPEMEDRHDLSAPQPKPKWPVVWDTSRSRRYNHDVLRDYEQRRFQEIAAAIERRQHGGDDYQSSSSAATSPAAAVQQLLQRGLQFGTQNQSRGGIFERLASEWKAARGAPLPVAPFPQRAGVMAIARFKRTKKLLTSNQ